MANDMVKMMRRLADHSQLVQNIIESITNVDLDTPEEGDVSCKVTITLRGYSETGNKFDQFVGFYDPEHEHPLTSKADWVRIVQRVVGLHATFVLDLREWSDEMLGE